MTGEEIEKILEAYQPDEKSENLTHAARLAISEVIGDLWFVCPSQYEAKVSI